MATPLVAGNWKMNPPTVAEAVALAQALREPLSAAEGVERVVCPPFVALTAVADALAGSPIALGAQNVHPEPKGAFTGEVAGAMLQGVCSHVIVGHSERRHGFGETDGFVSAKVLAVLGLGMTPVLCVGETLEERDAGEASAVVERQTAAGVAGVASDDLGRVVLAYEPVWAIGTGRAATPETAQEMLGGIRAHLGRLTDSATAAQVRLLYGGSVNAANAAELAALPDVDGALVGGASLDPDAFVAIAKAFAGRA
ncbi:MAG: triose-phosphate isomerase [Chloroflexi bacterium]|nr:triose-phosphate isomerase [Chloroflexota bacterium]